MAIRALLTRAAIAAALAATAPAAFAANAAAARGLEPCAWGFYFSPEALNYLLPDEAARYWVSFVPVPRGGRLEISGRYAQARYQSLVSYGPTYTAIDSLTDTEIEPDPGSVNPFRTGADRTAPARDWRVQVLEQSPPATGRPPNTLYLRSRSATTLPGWAAFALRTYQADDGLDVTGGVGLPTVTEVRGNGSRRKLRTCSQNNPLRIPPLSSAKLERLLKARPPIAPLDVRGRNPPVWHRHTNALTAAVRALFDAEQTAALSTRLSRITDRLLPAGGLGENPDNKYVYASYARGFGEVLLLRGRLPLTPRTRGGEPVMATGDMRYWSMCTGAQDTSTYGCLIDDEVPVDAQRDFAIAISPTRPANARPECGIGWLPSGPVPQSLVIMRNMLPDPGFAQAIQRARPGSEAATMGPYLPRGMYYRDNAAFEREVGCSG